MSENLPVDWFNDFLGVAYRFYDLRMNVVPLFTERKQAANFWTEIVHWWFDSSIRLRFVESGDSYWFILTGESKRPNQNLSFYKILKKSEHFERFKNGNDGVAYLRFGVYSKKLKNEVKDDAICNCGHPKDDHDESENDDTCYFEDCNCEKFETFQVVLLKKKKTISDIKFLTEEEVKDDSTSWNCFNSNKFNEEN